MINEDSQLYASDRWLKPIARPSAAFGSTARPATTIPRRIRTHNRGLLYMKPKNITEKLGSTNNLTCWHCHLTGGRGPAGNQKRLPRSEHVAP